MRRAHRGLKKAGLRSYEVSGPAGRYEIERDRPWRWLVRPFGFPPAFYHDKFKRLSEARLCAEAWAGAMPYFLDRR